MKIFEVMSIIKAEKVLKRTPTGRRITEHGVDNLNAMISDEKNWGSKVKKCLNCGIVISELLVPEGCPNCGSKDLTSDIKLVGRFIKE